MLLSLLSYFVIITTSLADSKDFCRVLETSSQEYPVIHGFYTPAPDDRQKYFLVVNDYLCEMKITENASQTQHFGRGIDFKDRTCRQSGLFKPSNGYYPASGFATSHGERGWEDNLLGVTWWGSNEIYFATFPIGTTELTPRNDDTMTHADWGTFRPTSSYVVFSLQQTRFVALFSMDRNNTDDNHFHYTIQWRLYNMNDEKNGFDLVPRGVIANPNDRQFDRTPHYYNIPRAVLELNTSLIIQGLFGLRLGPERNGTVILFTKEDNNTRYKYRFYYCVTEEHNLSEECNSYGESTENLIRLIDCEVDVLPDTTTATIGPLVTDASNREKASIVIWIVIIIVVVLIVVAVVIGIVWLFHGHGGDLSKSDTNKKGPDARGATASPSATSVVSTRTVARPDEPSDTKTSPINGPGPSASDTSVVSTRTVNKADEPSYTKTSPINGPGQSASNTSVVSTRTVNKADDRNAVETTKPMTTVESNATLDLQRSAETFRPKN